MPYQLDRRMIKSKLEKNPQLAEIIKDRYDVYNDYEVYEILISVKKFLLEKIDEGYKFSFIDGAYCVIAKYEGILYMNNDVIIRSKIFSKKSPKCLVKVRRVS
jgi:hypothetical protein